MFVWKMVGLVSGVMRMCVCCCGVVCWCGVMWCVGCIGVVDYDVFEEVGVWYDVVEVRCVCGSYVKNKIVMRVTAARFDDARRREWRCVERCVWRCWKNVCVKEVYVVWRCCVRWKMYWECVGWWDRARRSVRCIIDVLFRARRWSFCVSYWVFWWCFVLVCLFVIWWLFFLINCCWWLWFCWDLDVRCRFWFCRRFIVFRGFVDLSVCRLMFFLLMWVVWVMWIYLVFVKFLWWLLCGCCCWLW